MSETLYIDTSVISALFDERTPERKSMTEDFWRKSKEYERCISSLVEEEISSASSSLQKKMEKVIRDFEVLPMTEHAKALAEKYIQYEVIPERYMSDALHIAVAVVNDLDYLVSWNFTHIVNVKTRRMVNLINEMEDFPLIDIIAPPEL